MMLYKAYQFTSNLKAMSEDLFSAFESLLVLLGTKLFAFHRVLFLLMMYDKIYIVSIKYSLFLSKGLLFLSKKTAV